MSVMYEGTSDIVDAAMDLSAYAAMREMQPALPGTPGNGQAARDAVGAALAARDAAYAALAAKDVAYKALHAADRALSALQVLRAQIASDITALDAILTQDA